jgi:hypothetical protein
MQADSQTTEDAEGGVEAQGELRSA